MRRRRRPVAAGDSAAAAVDGAAMTTAAANERLQQRRAGGGLDTRVSPSTAAQDAEAAQKAPSSPLSIERGSWRRARSNRRAGT
jgi:hypothetical protein